MEFENESKVKAKKMAKIIIALIIVIGISIIVFTVILPNVKSSDNKKDEEAKIVEIPDNAITGEFEINSYINFGKKKKEYATYIEDESEDEYSVEYKEISFSAKDFNLPDNLMDYNSDIKVRLTYSPDDYKVYNCIVIDAMTGEEITDLSEENLEKLYNIEYGKKIIEKEWTEEIKLSELKENEIYKYSVPEEYILPNIINDIGKNCLVYTKTSDEEDSYFNKYDRNVYAGHSIESQSASFSWREGDVLYIMYKKITNEEILKLIKEDKMIVLDKYNNGDELDYSLDEYIYNNNNFPVQIVTTDNAFGEEITKSYWLDANEIWGFDWMIDSAVINY